MSSSDQPFSVLNESVLAGMEVRHDPYDYAFVENAMPASMKEEILANGRSFPVEGPTAVPIFAMAPSSMPSQGPSEPALSQTRRAEVRCRSEQRPSPFLETLAAIVVDGFVIAAKVL
jgi:hypothetical protein